MTIAQLRHQAEKGRGAALTSLQVQELVKEIGADDSQVAQAIVDLLIERMQDPNMPKSLLGGMSRAISIIVHGYDLPNPFSIDG